jgi:hypothetical protein
MGYDIHITRKANYFDEEPNISLEEWEAYAESDPMLSAEGTLTWRINGNLVEAKIFEVRKPGSRGHTAAVLFWYRGDVSAKNPSKAGIAHMASIAARLKAKVQGDEGELYDAQGNQMGEA